MVLKSQDELMNAIIQLGTKQSSLPSDLDKELHSPVTPEERAEAEGEAEGEFKTLLNDLDMTEGEWAEWQVSPLASLSSLPFTRKPALHVSAPLSSLGCPFLVLARQRPLSTSTRRSISVDWFRQPALGPCPFSFAAFPHTVWEWQMDMKRDGYSQGQIDGMRAELTSVRQMVSNLYVKQLRLNTRSTVFASRSIECKRGRLTYFPCCTFDPKLPLVFGVAYTWQA